MGKKPRKNISRAFGLDAARAAGAIIPADLDDESSRRVGLLTLPAMETSREKGKAK
jgi:hypothetical protein